MRSRPAVWNRLHTRHAAFTGIAWILTVLTPFPLVEFPAEVATGRALEGIRGESEPGEPTSEQDEASDELIRTQAKTRADHVPTSDDQAGELDRSPDQAGIRPQFPRSVIRPSGRILRHWLQSQIC
ncbi:MAG: hypothetical protein AB7I30_01740 [Isosphaeraceae bacterium]